VRYNIQASRGTKKTIFYLKGISKELKQTGLKYKYLKIAK
jgi:hypothetical protein